MQHKTVAKLIYLIPDSFQMCHQQQRMHITEHAVRLLYHHYPDYKLPI